MGKNDGDSGHQPLHKQNSNVKEEGGGGKPVDVAEESTSIIHVDPNDPNSSYEVGKQIGKGSFGVIFAATRLSDKKPVAIKFVSSFQAVCHWNWFHRIDSYPYRST